jgi:hypothetical protein
MIIASYPVAYMNLWLKSQHYSVAKVNTYPTGVNAVTAVSSWLGTTLASIYPSWAIYSISMGSVLFSCICMTVWTIPNGLKFFAWYLLGLTGCASPILYSTANTVLKHDAEERALVIVRLLSGTLMQTTLTDLFQGINDVHRIFVQHMGPIPDFPNGREIWSATLAKGLANQHRVLDFAVGRFHCCCCPT